MALNPHLTQATLKTYSSELLYLLFSNPFIFVVLWKDLDFQYKMCIIYPSVRWYASYFVPPEYLNDWKSQSANEIDLARAF